MTSPQLGAAEELAGELEVRGGAGGVSARLDDLECTGALLCRLAVALTEAAGTVLAVAGDPALAATGVVAPATYLRAEASLAVAVGGPHGAVALAVRIGATGAALAATARAYRQVEASVGAGLRGVRLAAGWVAAPWLAAGGAAVLQLGCVVALVGGRRVPATRVGAVTLRLLSRHGGVFQSAVGTLPGAVAAVVSVVPAAGPLWAGASHGRWPPSSMRDVARLAGASGRFGPWLREPVAVRVQVASPGHAVAAPSGLAGVVAAIPQAEIGADPRIRVERVTAPDGGRSWVVGIPGTASWRPVPGRTPFDLSGNVHVMAGERTAAQEAVVRAMRVAGVGPRDPVLLAGHSQGGMVAGVLAADERFRREFRVTHVVTVGSPMGSIPVPDDVQVLALEHTDDLVPTLDGTPNPDRARWVTVRRAATSDPALADVAARYPVVTHLLPAYERTAALVDASDDPSLRAFRGTLSPFLERPGAEAVAIDVEAERAIRSRP